GAWLVASAILLSTGSSAFCTVSTAPVTWLSVVSPRRPLRTVWAFTPTEATPPVPVAFGRPLVMLAVASEHARSALTIEASASGSTAGAHFCWPVVGSDAVLLFEPNATLLRLVGGLSWRGA